MPAKPPVAPAEMGSHFYLKRTDASYRVSFRFEVWFASVACLLALGHCPFSFPQIYL